MQKQSFFFIFYLLNTFTRLAGSTGTLLTSPLEVVKTRFQSSTSSFKQIIEQQHKAGEANKLSTSTTIGHIKNSCTSNLNNLSNRVKLASRAAHSCSLNSTILFKNNHLSQHSSNLMTSGFNFDTSQQNFKCLNTSSKVLHRPGLGIYLHLKWVELGCGWQQDLLAIKLLLSMKGSSYKTKAWKHFTKVLGPLLLV